jgi:hypothetical protein
MPLDIVLGSLVFFYSLSNELESYEGLFQSGDNRNATFGGFSEKWNWYQSIYTVAGGSVFKFSETTSLDIHSFLTFLEFKIDLANEENKHIQKK